MQIDMSDVILQTHPLEFQNSRQATKITYLQKEIAHLQDTIKDLEQLCKINKEALKLITNNPSPAKLRHKGSSQEDITGSTFDAGSSPNNEKDSQQLYENLLEENSKLIEMIEKLKKERTIAQSKALLSEQICEEVQRHEQEVLAEMDTKILELRKMVQDKEYFIQQLEKVKPFPDQDGIVVKFRDVMSATDQNLKLHEEINNYNLILMKLAKENNKMHNEKEELIQINTNLSNEIIRLRTSMITTNTKKFSLKGLLEKGAKNFLNKSHYRIKTPISSPLVIPDDLESNSSHRSNGNNNGCGPSTKPSKFKRESSHRQNNNNNKAEPQPPQRYSSNPLLDMKLLDKIGQLETELDKEKKKLMVETINNNNLSDEITKMKRTITEIAATNEILCKSNKKYQEKWDNILYSIEFYKAFFHKYMSLISIRKPSTRNAIMEIPNLEALKKIHETLVNELGLELKPLPEKTYKDQESNEIVLRAKDYNTPQKRKESRSANLCGFTKHQSKVYLLSLAKELEQFGKKDLQEDFIVIPKINRRKKRSMSNALDYVCERKKHVFETIPEEEPQDMKQKKGHRKGKGSLDHDSNKVKPETLSGNLNMHQRISSYNKQHHHLAHGDHKSNRSESRLSFSIDLDEIERYKAAETSFISTNDILYTAE